MTVKPIGNAIYRGLAADIKPTDSTVPNNSIFIEINTGKISHYNGTSWTDLQLSTLGGTIGDSKIADLAYSKLTSVPTTLNYTYLIYKSGPTYYAQGGIGTSGALTSNSNFATLLNSIVTGISPAGTPTLIKLGPGDFIVSSVITMAAARLGNIIIDGMGMDITNLKISSAIATGTAITFGENLTVSAGNTGTLTANANVKTTTLTMSTTDAAKFAVDDYVLVRSTAAFVSPVTLTSEALQGEIHRISAKPSTTTLTLDVPLFDSYTTANTATAINITSSMLNNITLSNLSISKHTDYGTDNVNNTVLNFVQFKYINNLKLEKIKLVDNVAQYDSGLIMFSCINSFVSDCYLHQSPSNFYNRQYGIAVKGASQNIAVSNCQAWGRFRHAFEMGGGVISPTNFEGVPRNILCADCNAFGGEVAPFDTHADGEFISFDNCHVLGTYTQYGMYIRAKNSRLNNCSVTNSTSVGIYLDENATGTQLIGCSVDKAQYFGLRIGSASYPIKNVSVIGGSYTGNSDWAIRTYPNSDYLTVMGVTLKDGSYGAFYADDTDNININNNIVANHTTFGIYIAATTRTLNNVRITNNDLSGQSASKLTIEAGVKGNSIVNFNLGYNPVLSPAQITSDQNDYTPTGYAWAEALRLTTDASRTITGLVGGYGGKVMTIHNIGSNNIVLSNQNASSVAANRFLFTYDITLSADKSITLRYDSTTQRWRNISMGNIDIVETNKFTNDTLKWNGTNYVNTRNMVFPSAFGPIQRKWGLYQFCSGASSAGVGMLAGIGVTGAAPTGATLTYADGTRPQRFTPAASSGATNGYASGTGLTCRGWNPRFKSRFRMNNKADSRLFIGTVSTAAIMTTDDPLSGKSGILFGKIADATNTNFVIIHNDGTGATVLDTVATADNSIHVFEIRADDTNSKYWWSFDGGAETGITTDIPAQTTSMGFVWNVETTNTTQPTTDIFYIEMETD